MLGQNDHGSLDDSEMEYEKGMTFLFGFLNVQIICALKSWAKIDKIKMLFH